jgi:hypothetical protein
MTGITGMKQICFWIESYKALITKTWSLTLSLRAQL